MGKMAPVWGRRKPSPSLSMMGLVLQDVPHLQFLIRVNLSQKFNQGGHATGMPAGPFAQGTAFLPVRGARETAGIGDPEGFSQVQNQYLTGVSRMCRFQSAARVDREEEGRRGWVYGS
jgi:hypothetical protein